MHLWGVFSLVHLSALRNYGFNACSVSIVRTFSVSNQFLFWLPLHFCHLTTQSLYKNHVWIVGKTGSNTNLCGSPLATSPLVNKEYLLLFLFPVFKQPLSYKCPFPLCPWYWTSLWSLGSGPLRSLFQIWYYSFCWFSSPELLYGKTAERNHFSCLAMTLIFLAFCMCPYFCKSGWVPGWAVTSLFFLPSFGPINELLLYWACISFLILCLY